MKKSLDRGSVFISGHGCIYGFFFFWALLICCIGAEKSSAHNYTEITSVELSRTPLRVSVSSKGAPLQATSRKYAKANRVEILLGKAGITPGLTDSLELPAGLLQNVDVIEQKESVKIVLDFGKNDVPPYRLDKNSNHLAVTFSLKTDSASKKQTAWKNPAGANSVCSAPSFSDSDYIADLDRPFGQRRIGRAECIDVESENVCFFYDQVYLKYADPKDIIKTIDCMFNLHCPGTGQGGPGGGTEHVASRFIEQEMSPRRAYRDAREKAKALKSPSDKGLDSIEELRVVPLPEFPRRPYETGIDVKSWRLLRDLDRKDPKLAKIVAHSMVWADEKKRIIFLKDTDTRLGQIRKVISSLDRPSIQVHIESRIVRANKDWSRGLGILWGGRNNQVGPVRDSAKAYWGFGGNQQGYEVPNNGPANRATGQITDGINIPSTFAVNLPTAVQNLPNLIGMGVQFGLLKPNYITELDLRLQLGESNGTAKVVARPEIQVMDGERATIKNGTIVTLKTSSPNWGTHTELVPVDLKLEVIPKVLFNNRIRMDIDISDNVVDGQSICSSCEIVKLYLTREAHTSLVVRDGETCVVGGIIRDADSNLKQGWPFLMKIPVIGALFSSVTSATVSDELLVFITPLIVKQGRQDTSNLTSEKLQCEQP